MPKISAIIPTYNRANMIDKTIESLLNQTLDKKNYEIIVVDNNSKDNTKEVVKRYVDLPKSNVKYVFEENQGLHFSRHAGAKAANSEILAYTDDDAIVNTRWLEELLKVYERDETIDSAGGKIIVKWDEEPPHWVIPYEEVLGRLDYGYNMTILKPFEHIYGANFSIRKKRLFEIGGFNPDQIGDILIGDGESGLCDKMHMRNWKIVWVPDAIVWHLQKVSKNATMSDMKRRFMNNGVASSYDAFRRLKPSRFRLLIWALHHLTISLNNELRANIKLVKSGFLKSDDCYKYELTSSYYKSRCLYELRLIYGDELRKLVEREDWIN